jgi:hypothetical protein
VLVSACGDSHPPAGDNDARNFGVNEDAAADSFEVRAKRGGDRTVVRDRRCRRVQPGDTRDVRFELPHLVALQPPDA